MRKTRTEDPQGFRQLVRIMGRVLRYAVPHWRTILIVIALMGVYGAANGARIGLVGLVLDGLVQPGDATAEKGKVTRLFESTLMPVLPEEDRAFAVQLDRNRKKQGERAERDQHQAGKDQIENALRYGPAGITRTPRNIGRWRVSDFGQALGFRIKTIQIEQQHNALRQNTQAINQRLDAVAGIRRDRHDYAIDFRQAIPGKQVVQAAQQRCAGE